jgi:hypothetical protein
MTRAASPSPTPHRARQRGASGQAEGEAAGDLARRFADLETSLRREVKIVLRLEAIWREAAQQLIEIRSAADPVTGAIPARTALAHLRRLRGYLEQVSALLDVEEQQPNANGDAATIATPPTSENALATSIAREEHHDFDKTNPAPKPIPSWHAGRPGCAT